MEHRWNEIDRGKPKNSGKNLSQCHFVHHKSHMDWPRDWTRASAVGGRRLTAWAMARPLFTPIMPSLSYHTIVLLQTKSTADGRPYRRREETFKIHLQTLCCRVSVVIPKVIAILGGQNSSPSEDYVQAGFA
jgi:hypothetical protein